MSNFLSPADGPSRRVRWVYEDPSGVPEWTPVAARVDPFTGSAPAVAPAERPPARPWPAFLVVAAAFFMTVVDVAIVNVALPTIGRQLSFVEADLQWVVTIYALVAGGFLLLGGRAADLLGRRRVFITGITLFTLASLASGLATSEAMLIAARAAQGLGAALISPSALSIVRNTFDGIERNRALGIWGAIGASGATIGVTGGGLLTRFAGWEWIFFVNVPVGVAIVVAASRLLPSDGVRDGKRRYDLPGAALVSAAMLLIVYALSSAPRVGWATGRTLGELAVATALLIAFIAVERRSVAPLVPGAIFRRRAFAASVSVYSLFAASFFGLFFIGTLYMQQVLGYSSLMCGAAWLAATVTSIATAGPSQRLVTKTSPRLVIRLGLTLLIGALVWLAQLPAHGHYLNLLGGFVLTGLGVAFTLIPITIAAMASVEPADAGLASGLLSTGAQIGSAIGVAVLSTVAASRFMTLTAAGESHAAALTGGLDRAFWLAAGIAVIALVTTFAPVRGSRAAEALLGTEG